MGAKKTLIAVPCFDMVHTDFFESFTKLRKPEGTSFTVIKNTMIYDARNIIALNAIDAGFDRVLWLDSDMTFPPDALGRLSADMDTGLDFVTGVYYTRRPPEIKPVIFKELHWEIKDNGKLDTGAEFYFDYPENALFEIAAAGFGCCLTSVDLLRRVRDKFGSPFTPFEAMGEDMSFCFRAAQIGAHLFCNSGIQCGHIGQYTFDRTWDHIRTDGAE